MKAILADPAIKKALVSISPTSRQNPLIRQMCHPCSRWVHSDHYQSRQDLERFAERISKGERWFFDENTTQNFIEELARSERQEAVLGQSRELIEEYRQSLYQEDLEFYDSLPEYSQAVTARLDLYQQYSSRVDEAGKRGGWQAAQAEFNKILNEDPRLRPRHLLHLNRKADYRWSLSLY